VSGKTYRRRFKLRNCTVCGDWFGVRSGTECLGELQQQGGAWVPMGEKPATNWGELGLLFAWGFLLRVLVNRQEMETEAGKQRNSQQKNWEYINI